MARSEIVNGPSKWDFIMSLGEGDSFHRKSVQFRLKQTAQAVRVIADVVINRVSREDGSGESWLFDAFMVPTPTEPKLNNRVSGYFSTQDRRGWLEIQDEKGNA